MLPGKDKPRSDSNQKHPPIKLLAIDHIIAEAMGLWDFGIQEALRAPKIENLNSKIDLGRHHFLKSGTTFLFKKLPFFQKFSKIISRIHL